MKSVVVDTIAAIATPIGRGGVGIIRISGPKACDVASLMLSHLPQPRNAEVLSFLNSKKEIIDQGIVLFFPGPNSFTGENVVELHGHGGPVVLDCLLQRTIECGARLARPGEFSERAFLNGKIDLTQAEAIADLIDAESKQSAQAAINSLQGEFSKKIIEVVNALIELRTFVEAAIDFPEEEIDFLSNAKLTKSFNQINEKLDDIFAEAKQGRLLREGMSVVIVGKPNVGKSSLLNCLSGYESAIVTNIPGTTRDVLREQITIDGLPLHIIDTAGLRESHDEIEKEGMRRACLEIEKADQVLLVVDANENKIDNIKSEEAKLLEAHSKEKKLTIVFNKIDLAELKPEIKEVDKKTMITLSAKTKEGLNLLCEHLKKCVGYETNSEGRFLARRRHLNALEKAKSALLSGKKQLENKLAPELFAEDLRQAQNALSEITGEFTSEDLLGEIFSSFCIGK